MGIQDSHGRSVDFYVYVSMDIHMDVHGYTKEKRLSFFGRLLHKTVYLINNPSAQLYIQEKLSGVGGSGVRGVMGDYTEYGD